MRMRLDKFISGQLPGMTRSRVRELLRSKRVTLDGVPATDGQLKIDPETAAVAVDGEPVPYRRFLYIVMNKPSGVVTAVRDSLSQTVMELLPEKLRRQGLFPAGRLDKDTEGLLLITDDGELCHRMLSPGAHVEKEYAVGLSKSLPKDAAGLFKSGIVLEDGTRCRPAELIPGGDPLSCRVLLTEGRYHQVKRMIAAAGSGVTSLKRVRIGGLLLPEGLPPGESIELEEAVAKALIFSKNRHIDGFPSI